MGGRRVEHINNANFRYSSEEEEVREETENERKEAIAFKLVLLIACLS